MTATEYIRLWLKKASHDLKIARLGMDRPREEWVTDMLSFHAQQAIKVLLHAAHDRDPELPGYEFGRPTEFAVRHRYPDDLTEPSASETERFVELARRVHENVSSRVSQRDHYFEEREAPP